MTGIMLHTSPLPQPLSSLSLSLVVTLYLFSSFNVRMCQVYEAYVAIICCCPRFSLLHTFTPSPPPLFLPLCRRPPPTPFQIDLFFHSLFRATALSSLPASLSIPVVHHVHRHYSTSAE